MLYKGNDLDLRAPYARPGRDGTGSEASSEASGEARWKPRPEPGRGGPIPVDQTVLACCNDAYEAALFHGARDVRPEHLLYALTRVEAARDTLEHYGVRTHHLRCDTAVAIASETPANSAAGRMLPRASLEFEDVLRRAARRAGQDGTPASVPDLLRAVLSYGREASATALLLRAAGDPDELARWGAEPPAPMPGGSLPAALAAAQHGDVAERLMARLDQLEDAMRSLAAEVAADRKAMRDLMVDAHARANGAVPDVQTAVDARLGELGLSVTEVAERFEALRALAPEEGTELATRMAALEVKLSAQPAAVADAVAYMMAHGAEAEGALEAGAEGGATARSTAVERRSGLEALLRDQSERMEEATTTYQRDLSELYDALVKLGTNQQTLGNNLEAWRLDMSGDVSIVSNRLERLERALADLLPRPRPERSAAAEVTPPRLTGGDVDGGGFRRMLSGTGRMLPATWRQDLHALREALRLVRRGDRT